MGSVRRGLILALCPTPALAEVCDKVRPLWSPASGPAGPLSEAVAHLWFILPLTLLIIATALFGWHRFAYGAAALAVLLAAAIATAGPDPSGIDLLAQSEGCLGPAWVLPLLLVASASTAPLCRILKP